jgi:hypothetical protein
VAPPSRPASGASRHLGTDWSASHGFATLALTVNVSEHLDGDTAALASQVVRGFITMGELARRAESSATSIPPTGDKRSNSMHVAGRSAATLKPSHSVPHLSVHPMS